MTSITKTQTINKTQCDEFNKNPNINPLTGRKIEIGKSTHAKLVKLCSSVKKTSGKMLVTPPMGPYMQPYYDNQMGSNVIVKRVYKCIQFYNKRIIELEKLESSSLMEVDDTISSLKYFKKLFNHEIHRVLPGDSWKHKHHDKFEKAVDSLIIEYEKLKKLDNIVNDLPIPKVIDYDFEIYSNRFKIRKCVMHIYDLYEMVFSSSISGINNKDKITESGESVQGRICQVLGLKRDYLNYLVEHKIFTEEDILETFDDDSKFSKLVGLYNQFAEKYKKQKNEDISIDDTLQSKWYKKM